MRLQAAGAVEAVSGTTVWMIDMDCGPQYSAALQAWETLRLRLQCLLRTTPCEFAPKIGAEATENQRDPYNLGPPGSGGCRPVACRAQQASLACPGWYGLSQLPVPCCLYHTQSR